VFVPCGTYHVFYGFGLEALQLIWTVGAVATPAKVALAILFTVVVGYPLVKTLKIVNIPSDSANS
jgi:hypothetical protein